MSEVRRLDSGQQQESSFALVANAVLSDRSPAQRWHRDNWSNHAERYAADLQLIRPRVPLGANLMEIGSAPCHMTAILKQSGYNVVGVDIKPSRVADFIESMGLDVRECDCELAPLPFEDGSFSGALLCDTVEHLRIDPLIVLSEINRILVPGGVLLLTTPNVYSLPSIARFALGRSMADPLTEFRKIRELGHMGHVREYSAGEMVRLIGALGLEPEVVTHRSHRGHGRKAAVLRVLYGVTPRRFQREIVIIARKTVEAARLRPLSPGIEVPSR